MGTPEFPDLGKHCSLDDCKQIDFLPFTCDRCRQVFCLEHRSYIRHRCSKVDKNDLTVAICPLCAKGVRLNPDEDPNITWDAHVNTDCDPSNYEKVTKKKKCPVPGCREVLTFSNKIKCRDCDIDHCLKHRFGLDHKCPGPKKPDTGFPFWGILNNSKKEEPRRNQAPVSSSSSWSSSFLTKLGNEITQKWQIAKDGVAQSSSGSGSREMEQCLQCSAKFPSVTTLVEHVEKYHERSGHRTGVRRVIVDVCPKCSKAFRDPVTLVEHVEKDHGGTSRA